MNNALPFFCGEIGGKRNEASITYVQLEKIKVVRKILKWVFKLFAQNETNQGGKKEKERGWLNFKPNDKRERLGREFGRVG